MHCADSRIEIQGLFPAGQSPKVGRHHSDRHSRVFKAIIKRLLSEAVEKMCERQGHWQRAREPYLSEAIWSRISEHMTIQEWCKAAGTCKTSYNMPLKWARLSRDLPLEGVHRPATALLLSSLSCGAYLCTCPGLIRTDGCKQLSRVSCLWR